MSSPRPSIHVLLVMNLETRRRELRLGFSQDAPSTEEVRLLRVQHAEEALKAEQSRLQRIKEEMP